MRKEILVSFMSIFFIGSAAAEGGIYVDKGDFRTTSEQEINLVKEMQGKSLYDLRDIISISGDGYTEARKSYILNRYEKDLGSRQQIDTQEVRDFLIRENLGVVPNDDIYQMKAGKRQPSNKLSNYTDFDDSSYLAMSAKLSRESVESTFNSVNGYPVWDKDPNFSNVYAKGHSANQRVSSSEINKMSAESSKCMGNMPVSSNPNLGIKREDVYKCFNSLRLSIYKDMFTKREFSYLQALNLLTALVDENGKHVCMASYYDQNLWVTARHCVTEEHLLSGLQILSDDALVKLDSSMVIGCLNGCDVAFIKYKTPPVDLSHFVLKDADLQAVNFTSQLFIPGVEEGEIIGSKKPRTTFMNVVMWPVVGEGYCRAFKLQNGCMSHTCSTLIGFSGAPVYLVDTQNQKLKLVGIHTGNEKFPGCDSAATNYAVISNQFAGVIK